MGVGTEAPLLSLRGLRKSFGEVTAVDDVSLDVMPGEFVSLLGPSGCGKTTTLRIIAGFERPSSGEVFLAGKNIITLPPDRRDTAMVFQSYALFPHMTVSQNIGFGLRMRHVAKDLLAERVESVLSLTKLVGLEKRYPRELSGGQQQRVALARALAVRPSLLLLDEPLSNLDAKLRERMRIDLKMIQREVGITTLFVTHDQEEALTMSDRIVVMIDGRISEVGEPWKIYHEPSSSFAATFIGHVNVLEGTVTSVAESTAYVRVGGGLAIRGRTVGAVSLGDEVVVSVKEEQIQVRSTTKEGYPLSGMNAMVGEVKLVTFLGGSIQYVCDLAGITLNCRRSNEGVLQEIAMGSSVNLLWKVEDTIILKRDSGSGLGLSQTQQAEKSWGPS